MNTAPVYIGLDVCQERLDAAVDGSEQTRTFTNDEPGIAELVKWCCCLAPARIALEATGKLEMQAVIALTSAGLPVIVRGHGISLPLDDAPSTHILKPEPDRFPGLAANELFCMALARAVGLNVADTEYRPIGDKPCILVQRYDRRTGEDGRTIRIHQEDFCQAMGFPPERKYQAEGGPTCRDCIALLREWSTAPVLDIPLFIRSLIFNVLIGNADAHGKNYSLLYSGGERRLSPLYDLVSTLAWPELSKTLAMKIGACESVEAFTIGDWKKMANKAGVGWPMMREEMAEISHVVMNELDAVQGRSGEYNTAMAERLHKTIGDRSAKMIEALAKQDL